ncbi:MerR family DNA-binding transcriptional regulator [Deinococcus gobiensis]|uniref:MerR family DNA-binding transcriptional regulator n=1 Tax=Deinococcus gobiensis TaxID=502394 RepID=UPI0005C23EB9
MDLSISEFAQRSGVSPHALRHWHQQGILLPATVDAKTGYRAYTPDQLGQARPVHSLLSP